MSPGFEKSDLKSLLQRMENPDEVATLAVEMANDSGDVFLFSRRLNELGQNYTPSSLTVRMRDLIAGKVVGRDLTPEERLVKFERVAVLEETLKRAMEEEGRVLLDSILAGASWGGGAGEARSNLLAAVSSRVHTLLGMDMASEYLDRVSNSLGRRTDRGFRNPINEPLCLTQNAIGGILALEEESLSIENRERLNVLREIEKELSERV